MMPSTLTNSSPTDAEARQGCKHVASALEITWLQTHGHKLLTVNTQRDVLFFRQYANCTRKTGSKVTI